ncbi:hypothetical protein BFP70_01730 [Thioclava sp. SK-1]|uniref:tripartite tricarboxylate transporter TctB family protein n=1 Tax=Thioclava sp. SK-1 TaxID=1889770 RepID=UPI0008242AAE|nr:tripartite tricarboxylate transporter TctB family protein [Thioclava sp. SK-1]OCX67338.1 hypothetical protein BFP70_01730 [Thioclava sp. SK-1]
MTHPDTEHHDGTSDATPGGVEAARRPGELGFAIVLALASAALLYNAYGIAGFEALSSPGAIPMATTLAMLIAAVAIVVKTARLPKITGETLSRDIFPTAAIVFAVLLLGYGLLLQPFGFLPTSALFLIVAIKYLSKRSWLYTATVSIGSLVVIWLIFRIVFTVLMPAGIMPEAEFIQFFRNMFQGAK